MAPWERAGASGAPALLGRPALVVCDTGGRSSAMSASSRMRAIQAACPSCAGRCPSSSWTICRAAERVGYARHASDPEGSLQAEGYGGGGGGISSLRNWWEEASLSDRGMPLASPGVCGASVLFLSVLVLLPLLVVTMATRESEGVP